MHKTFISNIVINYHGNVVLHVVANLFSTRNWSSTKWIVIFSQILTFLFLTPKQLQLYYDMRHENEMVMNYDIIRLFLRIVSTFSIQPSFSFVCVGSLIIGVDLDFISASNVVQVITKIRFLFFKLETTWNVKCVSNKHDIVWDQGWIQI